jgi:hypothetical protein
MADAAVRTEAEIESSVDREEQLAEMVFDEIGNDSYRLSRFIRAFTRLQRTGKSTPPDRGI